MPETASQAETQTLIRQSGLRHIAIIMDGNRRWAKARRLPKLAGHSQGVSALKEIVRHAGKVGLEALTVYAFSTENWKRSPEEVGTLMKLFVEALGREVNELHGNNVRLRFIGDLSALSVELQSKIKAAQTLTANNTGLKLQVAVNYGSRHELLQAVRQIAGQVSTGALDADRVTEETIASHLYTDGLPDPDMIIRTGGEYRLSNYLLWQAAYAEFYVTERLWPEFSPDELDRAVTEFAMRERRYGR